MSLGALGFAPRLIASGLICPSGELRRGQVALKLTATL